MNPNKVTTRLHHVGMVIDDLDAAEKFVGEAFGLYLESRLDVPEKSFTALYFDWGGTALELIKIDGYPVVANPSPDHLAVEVEDVRAADARLQELGAESETGVAELGGRLTSFLRIGVLAGCRLQLVEAAE